VSYNNLFRYFTGELVLGKFNSPLEAQLAMMAIYVVSAVGGKESAKRPYRSNHVDN